MSTCGKCGGHTFKLEGQEPHGSTYRLVFVQCTACGTPVGVMEALNAGAVLKGIEGSIKKLSQELARVSATLDQVQRAVRDVQRR